MPFPPAQGSHFGWHSLTHPAGSQRSNLHLHGFNSFDWLVAEVPGCVIGSSMRIQPFREYDLLLCKPYPVTPQNKGGLAFGVSLLKPPKTVPLTNGHAQMRMRDLEDYHLLKKKGKQKQKVNFHSLPEANQIDAGITGPCARGWTKSISQHLETPGF